jgi:hypothetical protein
MAASVVDRGVARDSQKPCAEARAKRPILRDRNEGALKSRRGEIERIVVVRAPCAQVAEDGFAMTAVQRRERCEV